MTEDGGRNANPEHAERSSEMGWEATRADVVRQLRTCLAEGRPAATAVVTAVAGSAYRRPGARVVVTEGASVGAITAGCLEGPVADSARTAIEAGTPLTETYDLTEDEGETWGMGLGCNGVIDVLLDPMDESLQPALEAIERKDRAVVLTVVATAGESAVSPGDRTTAFEDGSTTAADSLVGTAREPLSDAVLEQILAALPVDAVASLDRSTTVTFSIDGTEISVFCDVYEPIPTLLVFGSQGDVRPVTRFARDAGFRVEVVSGRGAKATAERFPAADSVESVRAPDIAETVAAPEHTYAVLMSHNFLDDKLALESLLSTAVPYIGLMGPRKRFEEMRAAFEDDGRPLTSAERERISAPVGLDLGSDEPSQIAMSVVSEALAVANNASGGQLSERDGPIHAR